MPGPNNKANELIKGNMEELVSLSTRLFKPIDKTMDTGTIKKFPHYPTTQKIAQNMK